MATACQPLDVDPRFLRSPETNRCFPDVSVWYSDCYAAVMLESASAPTSTVTIPATFSPEEDVLLLAGAGSAAWVAELQRVGIERVLIYSPTEQAPVAGRLASDLPSLLAKLLDFQPIVRRITLQRLPGGGLSDAQFEELKKAVQNCSINRTTFVLSGALWVKHALSNLPYLAVSPSIDCLQGAFAGKPCVLVSPGPSLAKNIEVLKTIADRVLVIAGNRAVAPLRAAGIVPDIAIVADALDLSYQLGSGLLDGVKALVLDTITHPAVSALPCQRRFFYSAVEEIRRTTLAGIGHNGALPSGGSVATVAFTLALQLGCDPIVLIGQDLALSGDQYYIESAPDGATRIKLENGVGTFQNSSAELRRAMDSGGGTKLDAPSVQRFMKVPGYHGGEVFTSLQFDTYRRWLGNAAGEHAARLRIYNCTEGGAHIENMQQLPLTELASTLPGEVLDKISVLSACHDRDPAATRAQAVEQHIQTLQRALHDAAEEVQRCERISHQVERSPDQMERLEKAERKLNEVVRKLPFVVALASAEVERARRAGANAKNLREALEATRALYAVIKEAVSMARPALSDALQRLKGAA